MTPAARYQAAIEILDTVLSGVPAEKALTGWARRSRFAGSKDRAAVRDHVFECLRQKRSCTALGGDESGRGIVLGLIRSKGFETETFFTGIGHAPAELSEAEKQRGHAPSDAENFDLPDWLIAAFQDSLDAQAGPVAEVLKSRAPTVLRVNTRKASIAEAQAQLMSDGVTTQPLSISPTALEATEGARRVSGGQAYRDGLVELQDGASQALVDALPLEAGTRVLDYCAGGGGKTLAMAALQRAQYFAHDAHAQRLRDLPERALRAGINVRVLDDPKSEGTFDLVLCDAPCSGAGSWRRSPEAKWLLTPEKLDELRALQAEILDKAQSLVSPEGTLAYATCSVLKAENQDQVDSFLQRHPVWKVTQQNHWLPDAQGDGFFLTCFTKN